MIIIKIIAPATGNLDKLLILTTFLIIILAGILIKIVTALYNSFFLVSIIVLITLSLEMDWNDTSLSIVCIVYQFSLH